MSVHKDSRSSETEDEDDEDGDYAIIPPNGGYGWVVVFCAFYCSVIVDGIQLTFGVFLKDISQSFDVDYARVALAGSLMFGTHLIVGPLCAGFSTEFGLRPVTITGAIVCCLGVGLAYFSTGYWYLYITYGLVGGTGLGLIYMNSLIITGLYFTSLMPIAMGIVVCGTGVGTMVFAALGYFLLSITDWQTSFLIQAGLAGSMGLAAIAFKPLKPVRVRLDHVSKPPHYDRRKRGSVFIKKEVPIDSSLNSLTKFQTLAWHGYLEGAAVKDVKRQRFNRCNRALKLSSCCRRRPRRLPSIFLAEAKNMQYSRRKSFVERTDSPPQTSIATNVSSVDKGEHPKRKFIFEEIEFEKGGRKLCGSLKRTIVTMLDCHLLGSEAFFLFTVCGALQMASLLIVYVYEKERCASLGFSDEMSVYFVISLGGANTLWRLFLGGIATIPNINYEYIAVSCIAIGGMATMVSSLSDNIYFQFGFCVLFGLGMASFAVFRLILLLDLIEPQKVENATGINLLFMGVLCVIFPPLFGWIMEMTQSYNAIFLITGVILFSSGFMLLGLKKTRRKELGLT